MPGDGCVEERAPGRAAGFQPFAMNTSTLVLLSTIIALPTGFAGPPPLPEGKRFRQLVAKNFPAGRVYFGGTTSWWQLDGADGAVLAREFSYATPENGFKQDAIHPEPGKWRWNQVDVWIRFAREHGQMLRVHGPISPQCSDWAKTDTRTAEELEKNMTEYFTALCKRIDPVNCIKWMDVVNETVSPDGSWFGPKHGIEKWENPWPKIGFDESVPLRPPLYIKKAFEIAKRHAPHKKLVFNQYSGMQPAMWDKVKATIVYLRKQGLRVDGIGWQAHIKAGFENEDGNLDRLRALIRWAHSKGMSFHITEMNVWIKDDTDPGMLKAQAETFSAIVRVLLEERGSGVVTWNTWNLRDRKHEMKNNRRFGTLFNRDFTPRPAYYAIQKLLAYPPALSKSNP